MAVRGPSLGNSPLAGLLLKVVVTPVLIAAATVAGRAAALLIQGLTLRAIRSPGDRTLR